MFFTLKQIWRELLTEKTRMLLTLFAIAWGTFAVSMMLSIGEGLRVTFIQALENTGHNILMIKSGRTSDNYKGFAANQPVKLTLIDLNTIAQMPQVLRITPQYSVSKSLQYHNTQITEALLAVAPSFQKIHNIDIMPGGRFISPLDQTERHAVIVLGSDIAKKIFSSDDNPIGQSILVGTKPYTIIGVMAPKAQLAGGKNMPDALTSWIPSSTYELYARPLTIDRISLTYRDDVDLDSLETQIQKLIAYNHHVNPNDENIIDFTDFVKRQETISTFFLGMEIFLGIIGTLTLIIAGVGIANVMLASVTRATHEIGIRMALGARTYHIISYYLAESLLASFLGGLLGLLMSFGLIYLIRFVPMQGMLFDRIGRLEPMLSPLVILMVILILSIIGLLAGLFPAIKASRIDPVEALSYE